MENKVKIFRTITIILIIITVSLISFVGLFRNRLNYKENIIPEFSYGMEIGGAREFKFDLDLTSEEKEIYVDKEGNIKGEVIKEDVNTETGISLDTTTKESEDIVAEEETKKVEYAIETRTIKVNDDSVLNKESYEKTKAIIQERLEKAQIPEYNIRLDTVRGDLILEVPENENANLAYELTIQSGKFEMIDSQTGIILLDNNDIKEAVAIYNGDTSYQAYLQIQFNKNGTEKLKDISNRYVQITNEQGEEEIKYVELKLDGNTFIKTYFGEELSQGILQITIGNSTTDYEEFSGYYESANYLANILNSGKTPNTYILVSDNFVKSQITEEIISIAKILFAVAIIIISIILVVKYKYKGILGVLASIGYIAVTMLAIRYTNVTITLNSIFAIIGVIIVNYIFVINFLNRQKTDSIKHSFIEAIKEINITIIPLWVVAIIFTFITNVAISSVGMIIFWGLFVHAIYSFLITRTLYI